jgi:ATP phosphoribosyltransferase regulatory subunit
MQKPLLFEKPQGVRDFLPDTAANKRQIEREIANSFARWGYREIITPMFEYMETFQAGIRGAEDRVFKFVDRSGRMVALRADMTSPIARVAASLLKDSPLPLRLSYTANIFRQHEIVTGRDTEFTQSGVELIGDASPDADAEMLALAVSALKDIGLEGFRLALGQVGFLQGVLQERVADEAVRDRLQYALADKDYVQYERTVRMEMPEPDAEVLLAVPSLRGGVEILEKASKLTANQQALEALQNLREIWQVLEIHEVARHVQIDLSLLLGLNYYTGAIFEGYAPLMGFPICGGGRYDGLVERFGRSAPATGFIIGIERVLEILEKQGAFRPETRYLLCYNREDREKTLRFAGFLRNRNILVSAKFLPEGTEPPRLEGFRTVCMRSGNLEPELEELQELYREYLAEGDLSQCDSRKFNR